MTLSNFHKVEMDYTIVLYAGLYTSEEIEIANKHHELTFEEVTACFKDSSTARDSN